MIQFLLLIESLPGVYRFAVERKLTIHKPAMKSLRLKLRKIKLIFSLVELLNELLHPAAISTEVRMSDSRGRAEMNYPSGIIDQKLYVVNKPKNQTGEFKVQIVV